MEKTMHAVVTHGIHDYRLEQVPVPQPRPGELLVQVEACGICAGDLKAFMGGEDVYKRQAWHRHWSRCSSAQKAWA